MATRPRPGKRIALIQCDKRFEPYLNIALRSWIIHNPIGWTYILQDLGLTVQQRRDYRHVFDEVRSYKRDENSGRFGQAAPRLIELIRLCDEHPGATVLQLDADTLTLGSFDPWLARFEAGDSPFSAVSEFPHTLIKQFATDDYKAMASLLSFYAPLGKTSGLEPSWNFGIFLCRACPRMRQVFAEALEMMDEPSVRPALRWAEQSAVNAVLYKDQTPVLEAERGYNFMINVWQLMKSPAGCYPVTEAPTADNRIRLIHYAGLDLPKIAPKPPWLNYEQAWIEAAADLPPLSYLKPVR
jgi:hypothetical protein